MPLFRHGQLPVKSLHGRRDAIVTAGGNEIHNQ